MKKNWIAQNKEILHKTAILVPFQESFSVAVFMYIKIGIVRNLEAIYSTTTGLFPVKL
ncbi:hypothetical protein T11_8520 [Trichinella zimbabwensis]|uniref:Uncharacterized protein n=1 Tax=Trichinella zimbabwensis TaxID=268475 RepID=A0A0V1GNL4_9BILA|nr:hypothetical protein T11_453 [Trichinella zimbabwensis]KRY99882.1 hypothetical protein T11_8520 [Trichinella zimbabwensis]